MVLRSFFATDNDNLVVTSSSSGGIVGNGIINNSSTPNGTVFLFSGGGGTTVVVDDLDGGGNSNIFNDDDETDHIIDDGGGLIADGTEVESESQIFVRALDEFGDPTGPTITIYVFSQGGVTGDVWGFATSEPLVPGTSYEKTGGSNAGSSAYSNFTPCFAAGTLIKIDSGTMRAEDIEVGQLIWTRDHGLQPVRWVGRTEVEGRGPHAQVVFAPGTIGNDRELVVSQQHRILIANYMAPVLFGVDEVLVAARHLLEMPGVSLREQHRVTFVHFMFDRHQIIRSNDALTESFFLAPNSINALEAGARQELLRLFPSLHDGMGAFGTTAAMTLKAHEAAVLSQYLTPQSGDPHAV